MDPSVASAGPWSSLPLLSQESKSVVDAMGFTQMTPVQSSTIPLLLSKKDVVVEAVTGSGKTLAFLVPIFEILHRREIKLKKFQVGALIVVPTRELALQIYAIIEKFLAYFSHFTACLCIGGDSVTVEMEHIKKNGCNVVVGTPGRLQDLVKKFDEDGMLNFAFSFRELEVFIMDEADRLLSMGFEKAIGFLLDKIPKQRRTGLFSATMSDSLADLVRTGLRNPLRITVKVESKHLQTLSIPQNLHIFYHTVGYDKKLQFLMQLLQNRPDSKVIVYFATCASVDYFYKIVSGCFKVSGLMGLHGKLNQKIRTELFQKFSTASASTLFCTDIAARGLDFDSVDLVVHFDLPKDPMAFIHRCGRTARIGRSGESVVMLMPSELLYLEFLKKRQIPIEPFHWNELQVDDEFRESIFKFLMQDRANLDCGISTFVSFIRHYNSHILNLILKSKNLDFNSCLNGHFLFSVPKMPELRNLSEQPRVNIPDFVDISSIDYKDAKVKEQKEKRRAKLAHKSEQRRVSSVKNAPWSISKGMYKPKVADKKAPICTIDTGYESLDEDYREYKRSRKGKR